MKTKLTELTELTKPLSHSEYSVLKPWSVREAIQKQVDKEAEIMYPYRKPLPPKYQKSKVTRHKFWEVFFLGVKQFKP